jgi:hypothetical protein
MKKTCTKCKKVKDENDFSLTKVRGRMLRRSWCDGCMKVYYQEYRLAKTKRLPANSSVRQVHRTPIPKVGVLCGQPLQKPQNRLWRALGRWGGNVPGSLSVAPQSVPLLFPCPQPSLPQSIAQSHQCTHHPCPFSSFFASSRCQKQLNLFFGPCRPPFLPVEDEIEPFRRVKLIGTIR